MTSGGLGTMGYGLPAAIGVQMAHPKSLVIDIAGEASVLMNMQEMSTATTPPCASSSRRRCRCRCARVAPPKTIARRTVLFGAGAPARPGDFGLVVDNDMAWLVRARDDDDARPGARHPAPDAGRRAARARPPQRAQRARRAGAGHRHRLPARADAACAARVPRRSAPRRARRQHRRRRRLRRQQGHQRRRDRRRARRPRHRARAGAPRRDPRRRRQGPGLRAAAEPLRRHARAAITIGRDAAAIERVVERAGLPVERRDTLEAAVAAAFERAEPGDAVLLSPACASLDMFRNYGTAPRCSSARCRRWPRPRCRGSRHERGVHGHPAVVARAARAAAGGGAADEPAARGRRVVPKRSRCASGSASTRPAGAPARLRPRPRLRRHRLAVARPGDGLQRLDRAARQPALRPLHADLLPDPPRAVGRDRAWSPR